MRRHLQEPGGSYLPGPGRGSGRLHEPPSDGGPYAYLWLDALTQKVREAGRIVNVSVFVATGVNGEGRREILGLLAPVELGPSGYPS